MNSMKIKLKYLMRGYVLYAVNIWAIVNIRKKGFIFIAIVIRIWRNLRSLKYF